MKYKFIFLLFLTLSSSFGQTTKEIEAFRNLVGSSWVSEGMQLGEVAGKTIFTIEWGLNNKIVKVKTYVTQPETNKIGLRNEGIRAFNKEKNKLEFYEFDTHGSIISGTVTIDGKNIHYEYPYQGLQVRDSWIFISKNEYQVTVGTWENGKWKDKFIETKFRRGKIFKG